MFFVYIKKRNRPFAISFLISMILLVCKKETASAISFFDNYIISYKYLHLQVTFGYLVLSFFLMYIYDLSTVRAGKKWGTVFFPAGAAGAGVGVCQGAGSWFDLTDHDRRGEAACAARYPHPSV